MCRSTKVGDFVIGKWTIEELDSHLKEFRLPLATARSFDPYGTISKALWQMRRYNLPPTKKLDVEDFVLDLLDENTYKNRREKWKEIIDLEKFVKENDPSFKGFYPKVSYMDKFDKYIENFDTMVALVPKEVKNRATPLSTKQDLMVEVNDRDQPKSSLWA